MASNIALMKSMIDGLKVLAASNLLSEEKNFKAKMALEHSEKSLKYLKSGDIQNSGLHLTIACDLMKAIKEAA